MTNDRFDWTARPASGSFVGYLTGAVGINWPWTFEETVARLKTLSGQDPTNGTDDYKVSVEFSGRFDDGAPFSLYDYKADRALHVGGANTLNLVALRAALVAALKTVEPSPYVAGEPYLRTASNHSWPNR